MRLPSKTTPSPDKQYLRGGTPERLSGVNLKRITSQELLMNLLRLSLVLSFAALACGGGGGATAPDGNTNGSGNNGGNNSGPGSGDCPAGAVCMLSSSYSPKNLTVSVGATVSFINDSGIGHTVNFDGTRAPGVDDIALHTSGRNDRKFTQAGTFNFHCTQHVGMTGSIKVQ
jgi:plastocyanin